MANLEKAFAHLDRAVIQVMAAQGTPGLALALFDREKCARVATYGFTEVETQTPVQANTLFGIGSITKSFTAVAVLQAVERGLLDLQAPVTRYLPWFRVQSQFAPITIHHLLTHSAGLVGIIDRSPDSRGAIWALRETETAWPPGAHFYYSDAGYQVLGLVLEEVMAQPLPDIFQGYIFDPLEMTASEPAFTHAIRPRMARGYSRLYDDRPEHSSQPLVPAPWIEMNAGDCCIVATAGDMARFGRTLLNRGQGPFGPLLSPAGYDRLTHPHLTTEWGFAYGYGLEIHDDEGHRLAGHAGGMPGYEAFVVADVDNGLGLVLLQTTPASSIRRLAGNLLQWWRAAYLGQSLEVIDLSIPDPTLVDNAAAYAGIYGHGDKTLTLSAEGKQLRLPHRDREIALEQRGPDCFYANHPDFDRFLLRFGRAETAGDTPGAVVEVWHGPDWYPGEQYSGPREFAYPPEWNAYPGHYRAHIPWQTNFRVVLRKGSLWLVWPAGDEEPLTPLKKGVFRVGTEISPERLSFSQFVKGKAICANYSGSNYYRFFTR